MPLFVCDNCHVIENTACGHYWGVVKDSKWWKNPDLDDKKLCSLCEPEEYVDGSSNPRGGKWHGRFPRVIATTEKIDKMGRSNFVYTAGF